MTSDDKLVLERELNKMKDEIVSAVEGMITKSIREFEKYVTDINAEKFKHINETLVRFQGHHNDHYIAEKALEKGITDSRTSIMDDVRQIIKDNNNSSKNNIGMFIGIGAFILTIIWNLLGFIL
jgi:hypothetical protein